MSLNRRDVSRVETAKRPLRQSVNLANGYFIDETWVMVVNDNIPDGPVIEAFQGYLRFLARTQLEGAIAKMVDPSDIVQQTLLQAHRARDQFRGNTSGEMAAWLRQILARVIVHTARDYTNLKRDVRRERSLQASIDHSSVRLEQFLHGAEDAPSHRLNQYDRALAVANALESLPEDQRKAIVLQYWQGSSLAEIGQQLDRTPSAVAGLLHRGLKKLRSALDLNE